jgi:hypothetical protein
MVGKRFSYILQLPYKLYTVVLYACVCKASLIPTYFSWTVHLPSRVAVRKIKTNICRRGLLETADKKEK